MPDQIHILHIYPEPDFNTLLKAFLERITSRVTVHTVTTTTEATAYTTNNDVDCIVAGYDLPNMTGIDYLTTVRKTNPTLPYILYTPRDSIAIATEAFAAGATDYIQRDSGTDYFHTLANSINAAVNPHDSTLVQAKPV